MNTLCQLVKDTDLTFQVVSDVPSPAKLNKNKMNKSSEQLISQILMIHISKF